MLDFNSWSILNETIAFDPAAKYPDQMFGFSVGSVNSGKAVAGGEGGNWGGSMSRALWFGRTATDFMKSKYPKVYGNREVVSSQKRSRKNTASGNTSDHYEGNNVAYAVDLSVAGDAQKDPAAKERGDSMLAHLMQAFGHPEYKGGSWLSVTKNGYRYQVGWLVKNHYDHIHVGVEKTGAKDAISGVSPASIVATATAVSPATAPTTGGIIPGNTFAEKLFNNPIFKRWAEARMPGGATGMQLKDVEFALSKPGAENWFRVSFNLDRQGNPLDLSGNMLTSPTESPQGTDLPSTEPTLTPTTMTPPTVVSTGEIKKEDVNFDKVVATVIDKLEGGYFHPNMRTNDPGKFGSYHRSGETMFGLDRHAGHGLYYSSKRKASDVLSNLKHIESGEYQYTTPEAKEFWETVDKADAKNKWKWGYRGGDLENRLTYLAGRIMKKQFDSNSSKYLSPEAQKIINSDGRLLFNFIYATWNGSGWFEKWAKDFNKMVASGEKNTDVLLNSIVNKRKTEGLNPGSSANSLIAKGGDKIKQIVGLA